MNATFRAAALAGCGSLLQAAAVCGALAAMPLARAQDAASLQARYAGLRTALASNAFQRPLYLESAENSGELHGDVYARVDQPFAVTRPALQAMGPWCDILILHLNVKSCRASTPAGGDTLSLQVGRKFDQPAAEAYRFEFLYKVGGQPDYLRVMLDAAQGPMGTSAYRIVLEGVELQDGSSFLHLSYAYSHSRAARWATQLYLATVGRAKVGFSVVGHKSDGQPVYIGGTRGVVERNAMRFYLAIEAYLGALSAPAPEQVEKRLNDWYAGVERYPVQLHEMALADYLAMKRLEIGRQRAPRPLTAAK